MASAATIRSSFSRLIARHGVTASRPDGSTVKGMMSPLRDTPRADFFPESNVNVEATPRYAFRTIDPIYTNESLLIVDSKYYCEMVTPVIVDDVVVSYTGVILLRV